LLLKNREKANVSGSTIVKAELKLRSSKMSQENTLK